MIMKSKAHTYPIYNYPEIFSEYFFRNEEGCTRSCPEYVLVFVFSGELVIRDQNRESVIHKGEYVFLRKNLHTLITRKACEEEAFSSVFMGFNHNFLQEFYQNMKKKGRCDMSEKFLSNIIELPCNPYLESIYVSLLPYLHWDIEPIQQIVEIKLMEAVCSLLLTDEKFYACLFDFPETVPPGDIVLATDNYTQSLNKNKFTGFSNCDLSASYMEDEKKEEKLCLQCIMTKMLDADYIRLHHENIATNIYMEVGYKNVVRFTRIFDKPFDFMPPN